MKSIPRKLILGALSLAMLFSAMTPALTFAEEISCGLSGTMRTYIYSKDCTVVDLVCKTGGSNQPENPKGCALQIKGRSDNPLSVNNVLNSVITWVLGITGAIAVLMIVYGGIVYVTSAGNKERVENAKQILTYAIIGLIVIILARVIISLVLSTATVLG